jgi:hypothetical protein
MKPKFSAALLVVLAFSSFILLMGRVEAQATPAHLTVTITGNQNLIAGFNNTVTISIQNNFYQSIQNNAIYDVDFELTLPSTLSLIGDSHWHYDSMALGQTVVIQAVIYAPTSAIAIPSQGTLTATYEQLGDVSYTTETHTLSFNVYGWIDMTLYGTVLSPATSTSGGNVTISGNILNSGNLSVYDANVSITSPALDPTVPANVFVGEVDPNIPRPFSLLAVFKSNLATGSYPLTVTVLVVDNDRPGVVFNATQTVSVQITPAQSTSQPTTSQTGSGGIIGIITGILRYIWDTFFGSSSPTGLVHSYFSASTAVISDARQAGDLFYTFFGLSTFNSGFAIRPQ